MQEELKKIKEIFPEAKISVAGLYYWDYYDKCHIDIRPGLSLDTNTDREFHLGNMTRDENEGDDRHISRHICAIESFLTTKDFNKILDVLRSIARCEDE